jgi:hypothetical protein
MAISRWLDYGDTENGFGSVDMEAITHVAVRPYHSKWLVTVSDSDGCDILRMDYTDHDYANNVAKEIINRLKEYEAQKAESNG